MNCDIMSWNQGHPLLCYCQLSLQDTTFHWILVLVVDLAMVALNSDEAFVFCDCCLSPSHYQLQAAVGHLLQANLCLAAVAFACLLPAKTLRH